MTSNEDYFYRQLAKAIKAWNWVEGDFYHLYAAMMKGANTHLISVTFHHIESFEAKLQLLDSCLKLLFDRQANEYKEAKSLLNRSRKLNKKRNQIVHEPVIRSVENGIERFLIHPSFFDARAITKGKTTHTGPVINSGYKPSVVKIKKSHEIEITELHMIEREFKAFSREVNDFRKKVFPTIKGSNKTT